MECELAIGFMENTSFVEWDFKYKYHKPNFILVRLEDRPYHSAMVLEISSASISVLPQKPGTKTHIACGLFLSQQEAFTFLIRSNSLRCTFLICKASM